MDDQNITTPQPAVPPVDAVPPVPPPPPPVDQPVVPTPDVPADAPPVPTEPQVAETPPVEEPPVAEEPSPAEAAPPAQPDYITAVGQSMVDLLTDISVSDVRKQKVATEMRIPVEQVTSLCNALLEKIDAGTISEAELAFLITSPIADSPSSQESTT